MSDRLLEDVAVQAVSWDDLLAADLADRRYAVRSIHPDKAVAVRAGGRTPDGDALVAERIISSRGGRPEGPVVLDDDGLPCHEVKIGERTVRRYKPQFLGNTSHAEGMGKVHRRLIEKARTRLQAERPDLYREFLAFLDELRHAWEVREKYRALKEAGLEVDRPDAIDRLEGWRDLWRFGEPSDEKIFRKWYREYLKDQGYRELIGPSQAEVRRTVEEVVEETCAELEQHGFGRTDDGLGGGLADE